MEVKIKFDDVKLEKLSYSKEKIYKLLNRAAQNEGVLCKKDSDCISLYGTNLKKDCAVLWKMILHIASSGWFLNTVESCVFCSDEAEVDILLAIRMIQTAVN